MERVLKKGGKMQRKKTRSEIAEEFFVNKTEIQRLFGLSRADANRVFCAAGDDLTRDLFCGSKVRLAKVCEVLHISRADLRNKLKPDAGKSGNER